ncbi:MAG: PAS domain S-box protein, partial [Verrucomicrobia bacterium]|nr:PAS domain S-box protein [Verrucomicrobiota bacterium]
MPNLNILIIEDSESEAGLLVRELRRSGYEVTSRRIETEADMLTALQTAAWDVILSDYSMPHFSGLAALRLIKEQRLDIPLIFVSGTIGEDAAVMAMKEGAVDYLLKDRLARLGAAVAHALETRQLREKRKLAEEQLRLQQSALESAANAIVITNTRGELLWANPAFHTMTCYAPAEVAGQCLRFLKSGRHDEAFYRDLWETILAGRVWEGEIINRRKDGTLYPERMTITPVRAADAGITHFIAVKQDVTERKKLEGEVEFRERQISSFFSGAAAGLAILDANLCFVQINGALAEINGVPADEHIGKTVSEIVPHLAPEVVPLVEHVIATGDPIFTIELSGETPREPGEQLQG